MSSQPIQATSDSQATHPVITFRVNMELNSTEAFQTKTNLVNPHMLHADGYQSDQDNAKTENTSRRDQRNLWIPGLMLGNLGASPSGVQGLRHGDTFQVKGEKARYIKDNYTNGTVGDATSNPLWIVSEDPDYTI